MKNGKLSIAIFGCGHWGKNYIRNFSEIRRSQVDWCCDLNSKVLAFVNEHYPHIRTSGNFKDVLNDRSVDAVIVSTQAVSHYELVKACLLADKDVLVEKPLALSNDHASELNALANQRKQILMVGHTFLYNPAVQKIKDLIASGEIGSIYYLKAVRSHLGLIREDVNVGWDLATHDVSIMNFLLDAEPMLAYAHGIRFLGQERDDAAFIVLQYRKELLAHIHVSWADSNKQRVVEVVGSKGRILFDDLNTQEPVRLFQKGISLDYEVSNFGEYKYMFRDGDIISPRVKMQEPLRIQCDHFLDCVLERKTPLTDGANGLAVVRTMCLIDRALQETRHSF